MSLKKHDNYINGEWIAGSSYHENVSPSDTTDVIGLFAHASETDVAAAIEAARNAAPAWAEFGLEARKAILDKIGDELIARSEEIGRILAREEGKTLAEGIGETYRAGQFFQYYGAEVLRQLGQSADSVRPGVEVEVRREPVGVVGIITPWNFPVAIPAWKIAPALAYGNTVVFKPSEITPASAWLLMDIISRAGLPDGVMNFVNGTGAKVGEAISGSPDVDALSFTGSVAIGQHIARNVVGHMGRVQLEMGSKNALVVLDDADLDVAVACAINGAFFGTGQKCTASSRLIVEKGIHDEFVGKLIEAMQALKVGDPLDGDTQIGSLASEAQFNKVMSYIESAQNEGATLACGGSSVETGLSGFYIEPTLFVDTHNDMQINREEVFGPVTCVIKADNYEHALALSNDSQFGLSAGVVTQSLARANHFKRHSKSGCVMINLPTAGTDYHVPFGGRKSSSYGPREQGKNAEEFYTVIKTTYLKAY